jgi:transmembrane sensor
MLLFAAYAYLSLTAELADGGSQTYSTGTGEQKTIPLAGGSSIVLDAESALKIEPGRNVTQVFLIKGRAYFKLIHDPSHQTAVHTPWTKLVDVGTKFSVELFDKAQTVVITEQGMVEAEVQSPSASDSSSAGPATVERTTLLEDQILLTRPFDTMAHFRTGSLTQAELERRLAWRDGVLIYRAGDSLGAVVREINRYRKIKISVDPSARGLSVGGLYYINQLDNFAAAVAYKYHLQMYRLGPHEVLLSRKQPARQRDIPQ